MVLEYSKISSKIFDDICQNNNLNCINTIKQFKAQNNQSINLTHFPHNVHLTPDGHKLIGKLINDFICDKKITNLNKYCFKLFYEKYLGISAFYHDSAHVIQDGEIIAAAQEERFTRKKHDSNYPKNAINFVLEYSNLKLSEVDQIVFFEKPF